jgi:hypothetical protein
MVTRILTLVLALHVAVLSSVAAKDFRGASVSDRGLRKRSYEHTGEMHHGHMMGEMGAMGRSFTTSAPIASPGPPPDLDEEEFPDEVSQYFRKGGKMMMHKKPGKPMTAHMTMSKGGGGGKMQKRMKHSGGSKMTRNSPIATLAPVAPTPPPVAPTDEPSSSPSLSMEPTDFPTYPPTDAPTSPPSPFPTGYPTESPTDDPTVEPTYHPTTTWGPTATYSPTSTYSPTDS